MKSVIITGTNGMIGSLVLQNCLENEEIGSITSITRKKLDLEHEKLTQVIHVDFQDFSYFSEHFENKDICYYCIGVYTGQVPIATFKKITVDFTMAFFDILKKNSPQATACFLSGQGADSSEKSNILFAQQKGIAENIILRMNFKHTYIFRPGYIYPVTPRKEPNFGYKLMRSLYKPIATIYPNIGVTSAQLAKKIVETSLQSSKQTVFENNDIRK